MKSNDDLLLRLAYAKGNIELFKYLISVYKDLDINNLFILYSAYNGKIDFITYFIYTFKYSISIDTIENIIMYLIKSDNKDYIDYSITLTDMYSLKIDMNNIVQNINNENNCIIYMKYIINKFSGDELNINSINHIISYVLNIINKNKIDIKINVKKLQKMNIIDYVEYLISVC